MAESLEQDDRGLKVVQSLLGTTKSLNITNKARTEMQTLQQMQEINKIKALLGVSLGKEVWI